MSKFNYEGFKKILRNKQEDLLAYLKNQLTKVYDEKDTIIDDEYLYFRGESPVCLVSHLDTVHRELPVNILIDEESGLMWSPQGIGGDDRCGTFAVLYILANQLKENKPKPTILFTTNEEIGCLGASKASREIPKDMIEHLKFLVEIDRRGTDDCVFYGTRNKVFEEFIESFGFVKAHGSCSDISKLSPAWDIASTNLSSGYFSEHTKSEYINVNNLMNTINKIINILADDRTINGEKFEYQPDPEPEPVKYGYQPTKYSYGYGYGYGYGDYMYGEDYWDDIDDGIYDYPYKVKKTETPSKTNKKNNTETKKNDGSLSFQEEIDYLTKRYGEDWDKI